MISGGESDDLLLVCSGGGHLKQLHHLAARLDIPHASRVWVTFDTGLSESLLADERVVMTEHAAPRDSGAAVRNTVIAHRLLGSQRWAAVVSTGAGLAVSFLPLAAARGIPTYYVETAARAAGPSLSGRILQWVPGVRTFTQYPAWSGGRWPYAGSIFDAFAPGEPVGPSPLRSAVVSLGTTERYGFRRLLEACVPLLSGLEVLWQTGSTDASGLGIDARAVVPHHELVEAVREADVVIAHAGTGAAVTALENGRCPVLVPRMAQHGEHVDDHQLEIARELSGRGLAITSTPPELDRDVLSAAQVRRAVTVTPPLLRLA